jgi:membrane protease YdiL (CAAX protease family)
VASLLLGAAAFGPLLLLARPWLRAHRADVLALLIAVLYVALLGALAVAFGGLRGLRQRLGFRYTGARDLGKALAVWVVTLFLGGILSQLLIPVFGPAQSNTEPLLKESFDPIFIGLIVPTTVVLAPAAEELLFRGALLGWLRRRLPLGLAAPLSAAAFAGVHLIPSLLPFLFVFGLAAAWIRERTGSTFNTFVMHMTQNAVAVAVAYSVITRG